MRRKGNLMKRYLSAFTAGILLLALLCPVYSAGGDAQEPLRIVTTIFPEYDWVLNILGDNPGNAEVTFLLDNGVDLHSFQPAAQDILTISACDLFLYVGGESDQWVEAVLKEAVNPDMVVINLLEQLGDLVKEEELVEGMEGGEEEASPDEHVWLSIRNASVLTDVIAQTLAGLDRANAEVYFQNADAYQEALKAMDEAYVGAVSEADVKTMVFGDRFPFRYLADDYGLDYYAAFAGCSAETEASFETIVFLADKVQELGLPSILTLEGSDQRIAETIRANTETKDQQILTMDSMQSVTLQDVADGASYLSIMENNLQTLRDALK